MRWSAWCCSRTRRHTSASSSSGRDTGPETGPGTTRERARRPAVRWTTRANAHRGRAANRRQHPPHRHRHGHLRNTLRARMDKYGCATWRSAVALGGVPPPLLWNGRHLLLRARLLSPSTTNSASAIRSSPKGGDSAGGRRVGPRGRTRRFGRPVDNAPATAALAGPRYPAAAGATRGGAGQPPRVVTAIHCAEHIVDQSDPPFSRRRRQGRLWRPWSARRGRQPRAIAVSGAAVPFWPAVILESPRRALGVEVRGRRRRNAGAPRLSAEAPSSSCFARPPRRRGAAGQSVGVVGRRGWGIRAVSEVVRGLHGCTF